MHGIAAETANADHDDFTAGVDRFLDDLDRAGKILTQPLTEPIELEDFDVQNAFGFFQVIHLS